MPEFWTYTEKVSFRSVCHPQPPDLCGLGQQRTKRRNVRREGSGKESVEATTRGRTAKAKGTQLEEQKG